MVFKRQKWCLTFSKFHKTILAFKTPKCDVFITKIGILNAKKQGIKIQKNILNAHILAFKMPKLAFKFYEMDLSLVLTQ